MDVDAEGSRIVDFENGEKAMKENDFDGAIANFQKCMKKLSSQGLGLTSDLFPKSLQNIADCYSKKEDLENALIFKKFEKLYYETVLLHNGIDGLEMKEPVLFRNGIDGLEMKEPFELGEGSEKDEEGIRDRGDGSCETSPQESSDVGQEESVGSQTSKRALEYEQLAKLCLQQECISLALEYSGKATLLHRHQFGDDDERTKKSFELFTSIYAEAGKIQYSESMEQLNLEMDAAPSSPATVEETLLRHRKNVAKESQETEVVGVSGPLKRTRSILKKRSSNDNMVQSNNEQPPESPRRVTFADPLPQMVRLRDEDESDNTATNLLLFVLICILIILVSLLLSTIFCQFKPTVGACVEFHHEIIYYYNKLQYLYRRWIG